MSDQLQALLGGNGPPADELPPNSRYREVPVAEGVDARGRPIRYFRRRLIPPPEQFDDVRVRRVVRGDRPDTLAAEELGDPLMSWLLCDANGVRWPDQLTDEAGRAVRITLPAGIPGPGAPA
ncbi:MAG TPA: LysM domain-containing protein [Actinomycetota bacterium]